MKVCVNNLVSIIMPSYNTEKFIKETIESVVAQTYENWELLIIDDCSTDKTIDVLSEFNDSRIKIFQNKKNIGAALSRNKAMRIAKGEWIAFLDSDDIWIIDKLETQIKFMVDNNYAFTCAYSIYIDEESKPLGKLDTCPKKVTRKAMLMYNWVSCLTVMYHYPTVGLVQIEDISKRNDYAIWLQITKKVDCYCCPEILGKYRVREKSMSHTSSGKLIKAHYNMFRKCEKMGIIKSLLFTCINLIMVVIRKIIYVKNYDSRWG